MTLCNAPWDLVHRRDADELVHAAYEEAREVLHVAFRRAEGFHTIISSEDSEPYADYDEMRERYFRRGYLEVSDVNHNDSLLTDEGNFEFRALHDLTHLRIGSGFDFEGECRTAVALLDTIGLHSFPATVVLVGEVIAQGQYFIEHGEFPTLEGTQPAVAVTDHNVQLTHYWLDQIEGENC